MKVVLKDLTKKFSGQGKNAPDVIAVNNFNVEIPDGKLIGLLGPSGCGKSTALNLISGLLSPTAGRIFFGEDDVTDLPPENRGVGLVFQNYALYPHLTVKQNILFPLQNLKGEDKLSKEEMLARAYDAAKLVQIEGLMDRKPKALSGGQQQRVAIARALVKMPRVLLLDEPTSGLDPVSRDEILDIFISLSQDEGKTVFCSTHITSDLDRCADNIIYLKQGRIAENEPLCTLLQKYSVVQFSADNAPKNIDLIGARREKDGMSALVRNSELPAGVESAPAGLEDIMVHIEREGETK